MRVDDIAAEVGVSPRTFNNYFASKYEAVAVRHLDRSRRAAALLRAGPASESLWDAITTAVLSPFEDGDHANRRPDPEVLTELRSVLADPEMRGETAKVACAADTEFAASAAERTGSDAERDLYPRLVAGAVTSAMQVCLDHWLHAEPPVVLTALIREALEQVSVGLPDPATGVRGLGLPKLPQGAKVEGALVMSLARVSGNSVMNSHCAPEFDTPWRGRQ